jgi:hypothetical protein
MPMEAKTLPLYGLLAEFDSVDAILNAAEKTRLAGFKHFESYVPFPVHGLSEAMGFSRTRIPLLVACTAACGGLTGFFGMYYANVISYPLIIGGKPFNSWPAFIPITFELSILGAAFGAVFGMLALNGLPQPYHPVFNVPAFQLASRDRFFICIEAKDERFELEETKKFLQALSPLSIAEVSP